MTQVSLIKMKAEETLPAPKGERFVVHLWPDQKSGHGGEGSSLIDALDACLKRMFNSLKLGEFNGQTSISAWRFLPGSDTDEKLRHRIWVEVTFKGARKCFDGSGETELMAVFAALSVCYRTLFNIELVRVQ